MADPQQQQEPTEQEIMDSFRNGLSDLVALLEGVGPMCTDIDELIGMLKVAETNDAQLYLLYNHLAPKRLRRKPVAPVKK